MYDTHDNFNSNGMWSTELRQSSVQNMVAADPSVLTPYSRQKLEAAESFYFDTVFRIKHGDSRSICTMIHSSEQNMEAADPSVL